MIAIAAVFFLAAEEQPKSIAVMPLQARKVSTDLAKTADDILLSALETALVGVRVVGQGDIEAMLGLDKKKQALGCDQVSCIAELGGALGVDSLIYGSLAKLGKNLVLSVSWVHQKKATVLGRHTETIGDREEDLPEAVKKTIAALTGKTAPAAAQATAPPTTTGKAKVTLFADWEVLDGTWYDKDGAFFGSGGSLMLKDERIEDYKFAVTAELMGGPNTQTMAVCARSFVFAGGSSKALRNGTSSLQSYGFNFTFAGAFNVFRGLGGSWYHVNPKWNAGPWPTGEFIRPTKNRIEVAVKGTHVAYSFNGVLAYEFDDGTLPFGPPLLAVHSRENVVKFSDFVLQR